MKRSVRSGIAIAGMAGGFWLLGQAVANAEEAPPPTTAAATGAQSSEATGGSGGGDAVSTNSQSVDASNNVSNSASTGDIKATGGTSAVGVVAGNENLLVAGNGGHRHHDDGDVDATQNINTSVTVHSSATGATVTNSGNASAGNNADYSATATGTQNSEATGGAGTTGRENHHHHHHGGDAVSSNHQHVDSSNNVDNDATTGEIKAGGGTSEVGVVAGNGNTLYCTSKSGNVTCSQNITTIINIISQAGGATVTCSGNASAGSTGSAVCPVSHHHGDTSTKPAAQAAQAAPAAPAAHKAAAPAAHRAPVNTKAQPAGQLAFTGAETSAPLTLGLIALGAGGALTLAGRRRTATAAV
jgi:hypothetical protein